MSNNSVASPRVPGSEHIPFRPINAHGRTPKVLRADGSEIAWKNPLAEPLYQVRVDCAERGNIAIGPKMGAGVCDQMLSAIKLAIRSGKVAGWSNPYIVAVPRERAVARAF